MLYEAARLDLTIRREKQVLLQNLFPQTNSKNWELSITMAENVVKIIICIQCTKHLSLNKRLRGGADK